jgi:hypothetical protein
MLPLRDGAVLPGRPPEGWYISLREFGADNVGERMVPSVNGACGMGGVCNGTFCAESGKANDLSPAR